jgi:hypothetical protein
MHHWTNHATRQQIDATERCNRTKQLDHVSGKGEMIMVKRLIGYGLIGLLALTLVGGAVYILARPAEAANETAGRGWETERAAGSGAGQGGRQATLVETRGGTDGGQGSGTTGAGSQGQGQSAGRGQGSGASGAQAEAIPADEWLTVSGVVVADDDELTLETADGLLTVGLGQAPYRDSLGFIVEVGDELTVTGFTEDGEFKAGSVENLTSGQSIVLRDETGRPMWAGRGRRATGDL